MSRKTVSAGLAMGALILGLVNAAAARGSCVPVSGKIVNNFAAEDGSATLGVVALEYGRKKDAIKLKCALSGAATTGPGDINFIHSISCDDAISASAGDDSGDIPVHSSIVLYTTGHVSYRNLKPTQLFTFTETSMPILTAPARGLFSGVTGGQLKVEGAVYKSPVAGEYGSIDMKFSGEVCYGS